MKKILLSGLLTVFFLASCGGEADSKKETKKEDVKTEDSNSNDSENVPAEMESSSNSEFTICDCLDAIKQMRAEFNASDGSDEQVKAIEDKYQAEIRACEKLEEGLNEEEKKKMIEEAQNCL
ncbi:MAG: hypothetical protein KDC84_07925 [Crocinitomicaceae bacterium]|nr:hypothetical protein [Crocinitomicaceae bacterium]